MPEFQTRRHYGVDIMSTQKKNNEKSSIHHPGDPIHKGVRESMINEVAELYTKGMSYRMIAKELAKTHDRSISITTIGKYVNSLIKDWRDERITKLDDLKTVEIRRINKLELTYWDGWERSLEGSKRTSEKQRAKPRKAIATGGQMIDTMAVEMGEKSTYTEETFGDPRFLAGIQWCISMRCKILGIEAPIQFAGTITSEIKRSTVFKTKSRNRP